MSIVIVDYGMGNIASVTRAIEECGGNVEIASEADVILNASHVILPGVGAFPDGMKHLKKEGVDEVLREVANKGTPILGICLGMQLLANSSEEVEFTEGLGLIPGRVVKMSSKDDSLRVPHVGWNEVHYMNDSVLFEDIPDASDFYFVHSFQYVAENTDHVLAETPYGNKFSSIVAKDNVYGVQFHPEKSAMFGLKMLNSFILI